MDVSEKPVNQPTPVGVIARLSDVKPETDRSEVRSVAPAELTLRAGDLSGEPLRRTMKIVTAAWFFGSVWVTATAGAPLALYAKSLNASEFQFGLLSALPFIASLASMPASVLTDRTGARKRIFLWGLYLQRLLWVPIAVLPLLVVWLYGTAASARAMSLFLILVLLMHMGQAVGGPAWMSWMSDIVPERIRGTYFSRRRQLGILSAIPVAVLVGWLLDRLNRGDAAVDPLVTLQWCAAIFLGAAVFGTIDIALFHWVPDVKAETNRREPLLRQISKPLHDRQFLWFGGFVATLVFAVSFMGQFVTLYLIEKLKVTNIQTQAMLLAAPMLGQLIVLPVWGRMCDRMGKKPVLAIASLGLVPVGLGWCLMNSGAIWLGYILSAAGAVLWAGVEVANFNLVLEFAGMGEGNGKTRSGGSSYVAVNSVIINVAGCLGGLASGLIAQRLRGWSWDIGVLGLAPFTFYEVLFLLSGLLRLAAVVIFLPHIHEPDAHPTRAALRFMVANIYNNLFNAVLQPLRFLDRDRGVEGNGQRE